MCRQQHEVEKIAQNSIRINSGAIIKIKSAHVDVLNICYEKFHILLKFVVDFSRILTSENVVCIIIVLFLRNKT